MALDAIAVRCIVDELNEKVLGCRVDKIYQPEKDELILHAKDRERGGAILLSANASNARVCLTRRSMENPIKAPMFCMILRKHLQSGRITSISQPDSERIIEIEVEAYDELGDRSNKKLIIEIMGRHSNIILVNKEGLIIDSIKRVTSDMSRVRQVLPGISYTYPPKQDKIDIFVLTKEELQKRMAAQPSSMTIAQALSSIINGISRSTAAEIAAAAGIDGKSTLADISASSIDTLWCALERFVDDVKNGNWNPCVIYDETGYPLDFYVFDVHRKVNGSIKHMNSISEALEEYYAQKDAIDHLKQKTADLYKLISTYLERARRKLEVQQKELAEAENADLYKLYGQLITANLYQLKPGQSEAKVINFYSENMEEIVIPLDPRLTPIENAQRYFKLYNKAKNAVKVLNEQIEQTKEEIEYLEGQLDNINNCTEEADIEEIRGELMQQGYIRFRQQISGKNKIRPSQPHHFISSTGMDVYVGKNNIQNDMLTLKWANKNDYWLHVKDLPGSHVIIRTQGKEPDQKTLMEAAMLAAYYSKARDSSNVPVDYTQCKYVNKPSGAKPGKVIYTNYKTIYITPDKALIKNLRKEA